MNEFIIENAALVPFRRLSEENKITILKAKLEAPKSVELLIDTVNDTWLQASAVDLTFNAVYRVREVDTPLVLPWDWIADGYNYAAMLDDMKTLVLSGDDLIFERGAWRSVSLSFNICYITILNIDTTGIDWRRSKTRRPEL